MVRLKTIICKLNCYHGFINLDLIDQIGSEWFRFKVKWEGQWEGNHQCLQNWKLPRSLVVFAFEKFLFNDWVYRKAFALLFPLFIPFDTVLSNSMIQRYFMNQFWMSMKKEFYIYPHRFDSVLFRMFKVYLRIFKVNLRSASGSSTTIET